MVFLALSQLIFGAGSILPKYPVSHRGTMGRAGQNMLHPLEQSNTNHQRASGRMRTIYLAGPEVFLPDAHQIGERKKGICQKYGFKGLFPLDKELDLSEMSGRAKATAIYRANVDLISRSDVVVANLTPFRGPSMDVGTAFEIGFGAALHLPIFGYANVSELLVQRVVRRSSPLPSAPVDENGMEVENF